MCLLHTPSNRGRYLYTDTTRYQWRQCSIRKVIAFALCPIYPLQSISYPQFLKNHVLPPVYRSHSSLHPLLSHLLSTNLFPSQPSPFAPVLHPRHPHHHWNHTHRAPHPHKHLRIQQSDRSSVLPPRHRMPRLRLRPAEGRGQKARRCGSVAGKKWPKAGTAIGSGR